MYNIKKIILDIKDIENIQKRTSIEKEIKLYEEFGELCEAYLCLVGSTGSVYKNLSMSDCIEEVIDTLLCYYSCKLEHSEPYLLASSIPFSPDYFCTFREKTALQTLKIAIEYFIAGNKTLYFTYVHAFLFQTRMDLDKIFNEKIIKWKNKISKGSIENGLF
jgi:hypothetical protein